MLCIMYSSDGLMSYPPPLNLSAGSSPPASKSHCSHPFWDRTILSKITFFKTLSASLSAVDDNPLKLNQFLLLKGYGCLPAFKHIVSPSLESTTPLSICLRLKK